MALPYTKQTWQDKTMAYPLSAARMTNIENGLGDLSDSLLNGAAVGSGDAQQYQVATVAQRLGIFKGSAASPDSTTDPLVKVTRTQQVTAASYTGDGADELSAIFGISVGTAATEGQPVAVMGVAKSASTVAAQVDDACGVYGVGDITGSGTGIGIGAFFEGRSESASGHGNPLQLQIRNNRGADASYNAGTDFAGSVGAWIVANSDTAGRKSAAAIQIGLANSCQWDVGIGFTKIGGVSSIVSAAVRDDSNAATSILIQGAHATAAIAVASGSGKVIIGGTSEAVSGTSFEVLGPDATTDPLVMIGSTAFTRSYSLRMRNAAGQWLIGIAGGASAFLTGTAGGDAILANPTVGKMLHLGGTTKVITVTQDNKLGFFATTPIARPTGWAAATGTATRTTFDTVTVTLEQLAQRVKALIDDFFTTAGYGLLAA